MLGHAQPDVGGEAIDHDVGLAGQPADLGEERELEHHHRRDRQLGTAFEQPDRRLR